MPRPDDQLSTALARLSAIPFPGESLHTVALEVAGITAELLDRPLEVSVTVVQDDDGTTVTATGPLAADLDGAQYRVGDGPCLDAARTGLPASLVTGRPVTRWPDLAGELARRGLHGVWSLPFPDRRPVGGSVNLYVDGPLPDPARWRAAEAFARPAATAMANMYAYDAAVRLVENLRAALDSRAVIDQAKGILMERFRMTADQAFEALRRVSNDTNTKLREVAQAVVHTGDLGPH